VSLGEEGAVVLKFKPDEISKCWQRFDRMLVRSWDYHRISRMWTLTYNSSSVDLDKIKPL